MKTHPVVTSSAHAASVMFAICWLVILLFSSWGCQPDLQHIECVGSWCPNGQTCLGGRCWSPADADLDSANDGSGDLADVDADGPGDVVVDAEDTPTVDSVEQDQDADIAEIQCLSDLPLDQVEEHAIFIDSAAGLGGNGTAEDPIQNFGELLVVMAGSEDRFILVVTADAYTLSQMTFRNMDCFEIRGGYTHNEHGWKLDEESAARTTITSDKSPVLSFEGIAGDVSISRVIVNAPNGDAGRSGRPTEDEVAGAEPITKMEDARAGENSVAISAIDSHLLITDSEINAGNGGDGGTGYFGQEGVYGNIGNEGAVAGADEDVCDTADGCAPGGLGGTIITPCWSVDLRNNMCGYEHHAGGTGGDGGRSGGALPGHPGAGGAEGDGPDGDDGWDGNGGGGYGYVRDRMWHPVAGMWSGSGCYGEGGAGGDGGIPSNTTTRWSGGGGGGGSGGCGGQGGGGGGGGGGSIGIYLENSTLVLSRTDVTAGDGGNGGDGGDGGPGGVGGPGGDGGTPDGADSTENGENGYAGGDGGAGGHGGGGGGGISVAIMEVGDSWTNNDDTLDENLTPDDPGEGGHGLDDNRIARGASGIAARRLKLNMTQYAQECPYNSALAVHAEDEIAYCVDVFEAARADVAILHEETEIDTEPIQAMSVPAVYPWVQVGYWDAFAACFRGGGFLCDRGELQSLCEDSMPPLTADDCNFDRDISVTGYYSECAVDIIRFGYHLQIFDLFGNAAEWLLATDYESDEQDVYGGSFLDEETPLDCEQTTTLAIKNPDGDPETYTDVGFRCCHEGYSLESQEYKPD